MKSNNSILLSLLVAGAMAILSSANVHSQEPEPIGLMLSTVGVVTAEDADGNVRRLQRRSSVFEGDTLITANRARAQVRFNDRGLTDIQSCYRRAGVSYSLQKGCKFNPWPGPSALFCQ